VKELQALSSTLRPGGHRSARSTLFATKSGADFKRDTSNATKPEGMCASWRKVYHSTARERAAIIYPDDNRAVAPSLLL
jgi:hypothetical protein